MASEYYWFHNNKARGPYSSAQLKEFARVGKLSPQDKVCKKGATGWVPAAQIGGLFKGIPMGAKTPPRPKRDINYGTIGIVAGAAVLLLAAIGLGVMLAPSGNSSTEENNQVAQENEPTPASKTTPPEKEPAGQPKETPTKPPKTDKPTPPPPDKPTPMDIVRGESKLGPESSELAALFKSGPGEMMVAMAKPNETAKPKPKPTTPPPMPVTNFKPTPVPDQVPGPINVKVPPIAGDETVKIDYPIVYVRAPRKGDNVGTNWTEISAPVFMDPGADLMLLKPDGTEELLVEGGKGSVTDPMVSFDGEWVYYSKFHDLTGATIGMGPPAGADIFKIHVPTKKIVQLTFQKFDPNLGAGVWSKDFRAMEAGKNYFGYGVFNMGPCPLPGGKVMYSSNRHGFKPPKRLPHTLQLFVMDDAPADSTTGGTNIECIGHLNLGMALHPTILLDGRIMFSSLESQGLRHSTLWGLWTINPDGTGWGPMVSAFMPGESPSAYHFQTQLADGTIVAEEYYNQTSSGFGSFVRFPVKPPEGQSAFGPGYVLDPRNRPLRHGRLDNGRSRIRRLPFSPFGMDSITRFARSDEGASDFSILRQRNSPRVGKVTHPSAVPDNHLLCVYSPGPVNGGYTVNVPALNGMLCLIKDGKVVDDPSQMLFIKGDPKYNVQWPRALVPYKRIYGVDEPYKIEPVANDGSASPHLPAGSPFGLIGTSSMYKRESYPNGQVLPDTVTAAFAGGPDPTGYKGLEPFNTTEPGASLNWLNQGAEAGLYSNDEVHAIRILVMEPTTDRHKGPKSGRTFRSHASERLRVLGEIPVRKFNGDDQPKDTDGNPDTSFLAKIPADTAFTFQTLDKDGMVLNMAQTWHQVRPGEIRHDCGGCHAHSQKPTLFKDTAAAKPDYEIFDLTKQTPLLTSKANDQSGKKWDKDDSTGLRFEKSVKNVEYYRDVRPIFQKSCVACHSKTGNAAGNLVLDDDAIVDLANADDVPGTYYRLTMDYAGRFGNKPIIGSWKGTNASRYIRMMQARRSLLMWKVHGKRLDGFSNDDFPTASEPGNPRSLMLKGQRVADNAANRNRADLDYTGQAMPPPAAVKAGKVMPLTDEDRRTLARWIDLGCPIDLDHDPKQPDQTGFGWMLDDQRPTLVLAEPKADASQPIARILIGAYDYGGLVDDSLKVTASFEIDGVAAGENLAAKFKPAGPGIWEWKLETPIEKPAGKLNVSVKDKQGNVTRIERTIHAP